MSPAHVVGVDIGPQCSVSHCVVVVGLQQLLLMGANATTCKSTSSSTTTCAHLQQLQQRAYRLAPRSAVSLAGLTPARERPGSTQGGRGINFQPV